MTTANIIMAVALIILCGVAVWLIVRYMRKATEVEFKGQALDIRETNLQAKEKHFDKFAKEVREEARRIEAIKANLTHVGYTVTVNDPDGTAPEEPDKAVLKSLKSGLGYKTVPAAKKYIKCKREDGKTRYSLDLYFAPYEAPEE